MVHGGTKYPGTPPTNTQHLTVNLSFCNDLRNLPWIAIQFLPLLGVSQLFLAHLGGKDRGGNGFDESIPLDEVYPLILPLEIRDILSWQLSNPNLCL